MERKYYLNFKEDGTVWKVTNVLDESSLYINISKELMYDFAECRKSMEDFIVVPSDSADSQFELKSKHTSLEDFDVDKSIHRLPKHDINHNLVFHIKQNVSEGTWKASVSPGLKSLINSTAYYKDKVHRLFVTDEDDPNFLLDTLEVNFSSVMNGEAIIENTKKEVAQKNDVSVYCGKAFENYNHIVEE